MGLLGLVIHDTETVRMFTKYWHELKLCYKYETKRGISKNILLFRFMLFSHNLNVVIYIETLQQSHLDNWLSITVVSYKTLKVNTRQ